MPYKLKVSDAFYREQMENLKAYNKKLLSERKARLPYLDSQTNVAQRDCYLYFERRHRGPGTKPGSICSYPAKRWKKRPRISPIADSNHVEAYNSRLRGIPQNKTYNEEFSTEGTPLISENSNDSSMHHQSAVEVEDQVQDTSESHVSVDDSDFEVAPSSGSQQGGGKRKNKKKSTRGSTRSKKTEEQIAQEENNKPHQCMYCPKRYKNKPGLKYHLEHAHHDILDDNQHNGCYDTGYHGYHTMPPPLYRQAEEAGKSQVEENSFKEGNSQQIDKQKEPKSLYCDFCLGTAEHNKKTGQPEEMVSCADCIRSAHPTCLQFTAVMTANVKKYKWQCIECKSCHLCGTSDNDEQLLFCDDCDRGYHMYCLTPPMSSPPEGNWVCSLCGDNK